MAPCCEPCCRCCWGGGVALAVLSLGFGFWTRRFLARPLLALAAAAAAAGRGAVPAPVAASGVREIDAVAAALEAAAAERRDREAEALALAARLQAVLDHAPMGIALAEAPSGRIRLANRRLGAMLGLPPGGAGRIPPHLARDARDAEGRPVPEAEMPLARALAGAAPEACQGEYRLRRGDGGFIWVRALAAPIRDRDGGIGGAVLALSGIDAERQAAAALRESELRFRTLAEAVPQIVWSSGPDGTVDYYNRRYREFVGDGPEPEEAGLQVPIHPEDRDAARAAWRQALATGEPYEAEYRLHRADGVWRWFVARALPARDAEGGIHRWLGTATDVTELVETRQALEGQVAAEAAARQAVVAAAEALAGSESRFRSFAEASPDLLWVLELGEDRLDYLSPAFERLWGEPPPDRPGLGPLTTGLHPEDRDRVEAALPRLLEGEAIDLEYRIRRADGQQLWLRVLGFPMRDAGGRVVRIGGFARDATQRKAAEQRQRLLIGELNHRVKNTLATVLSLARQTARRGRGAEFLEDFQARLMALARGHDLLTSSTWRGATLGEVVATALAPWRGGEVPLDAGTGAGAGRVAFGGPPVWLAPRQALGLGLAIHEMASNAARHGALLVPQGRVSLTWHRLDGGMLQLDWAESEGPPVRPPQRQGFGVRLLESGLAGELGSGAEVVLDHAPEGFRARIRFLPAEEA
ncbi:PAS domain-containing protein [Siccirubricoccus sp. G192]|uniref:sensor histidine kinase n=1 Tax=Siccirubricoccus sp. G192 TaxID=2849651 RepID=UPI001C2C4370|nr:PAS domain-containing protein [Siccirubricoccus sp. G192]MBV1799863.1 PAS domain-containing protein [Siccirubricoccus sp. G192]